VASLHAWLKRYGASVQQLEIEGETSWGQDERWAAAELQVLACGCAMLCTDSLRHLRCSWPGMPLAGGWLQGLRCLQTAH